MLCADECLYMCVSVRCVACEDISPAQFFSDFLPESETSDLTMPRITVTHTPCLPRLILEGRDHVLLIYRTLAPSTQPAHTMVTFNECLLNYWMDGVDD